MTGKIFNRWTVLSFSHINKQRDAFWNCKCICGNVKKVSGKSLRKDISKSCGCLRKEKTGDMRRTHGLSKTSEYGIYTAMLQRCYNPNANAYADYGGRGIYVCKEWKGSFETFLVDMGLKPSSKHSLDRINVNGNYEPSNCRWATIQEQADNRRKAGNISIFSLEELQTELNKRIPEYGMTGC